MITFTQSNSMRVVTVGDQLRDARRRNGLSLREVSQALLIPLQQLRFLETDQFHSIPESMYRELFLKAYATYIGLDWPKLKTHYDAHMLLARGHVRSESVHVAFRQRFAVTPQLIKTFFLSFAIAGCGVYLVVLGYIAVSPPSLVVWSPAQDETSGVDRVRVVGQTQEHARLTINGESVMMRRDGTFEQEVVLSEGLNVITVGASKKYSKEHIEERRVMYRREHAYNPLQFQN